tara:strand:+ start:2768 stop:2914 length:147 start_codon:yes stop_codon:yes gene_type:complete
MSIVINPKDETIWSYKLNNGEVCHTPDWDLANHRGVGSPDLVYHRPND